LTLVRAVCYFLAGFSPKRGPFFMAKHPKPTSSRDRKTGRPDKGHAHDPPMAIPARPAILTGPPPPSPEAIDLFQRGMEAMQQHRFKPASQIFSELIERFPSERALLDRVRVYLDLCNRELSRRPTEPRTIEERLTAATAALNNGAHDRAETLARGVLAEDPHQDLALYLLSVIEVRRGAYDKALSYLGQAVAISPEARAQARHEPDFEPLRDLEAFRDLTDLSAVMPDPSAKRSKRPTR
jgi:thioredoxin-like negative regulator of GroEL